jgi:processive 1,2-diacylglycerol beta-glucosyltransferase
MENRILILTAGFGEGHNSAARGIRDGLAEVSGGAATVELHDIFAEAYGVANDLARKAYLAAINRAPRTWGRFYNWLDRQDKFAPKMGWLFLAKARLAQLLLRFQPTAVVSVYPAYPHLIESIMGGASAPFRQVVCITDSITVNAIWLGATADLFLVPNELTAAVVEQRNVPREIVRTLGFPVSPKFAELGERRRAPNAEQGYQILYMINAGGRVAPEVIRRLTSSPEFKLTVTVGRNSRLQQAIENLRAELRRNFAIIGWADDMPRLMLESHLLISKAGGATVQETIAAKCPMIINQVVPGQEEGNARLIVETGSGAIATDSDAILQTVRRAFADGARVWRDWSVNIARLSRPRASLEIAEMLLGL